MTWHDSLSGYGLPWNDDDLEMSMKISVTPEQAQKLRAQGVREDFLLAVPSDATAAEIGAFDQAEAEAGDPGAGGDAWAYAAGELGDDGLAELLEAAAELDGMGLANTGGGALELSYQHFLRGFAAEAAEYAAAEGDYDVAAQCAAGLGWDGIGLANGGYASVFELTAAAGEREAQRAAENADGATWHGSTEERIAAAYGRISTGTYLPRQATLADFASPSQHERTLAGMRHRQDHADFALTGGAGACGVLDELGRCGEPYHQIGCPAVASPEVALALREQPSRPLVDAAGRYWGRPDGEATTWGDWIEAATGQRQRVSGRPGAFRGSQELAVPRHTMFGDPGDPDNPGDVFPASTMAVVGAVRAQAGISKEPTGFMKGLERQVRYAAARQTRPPTAREAAFERMQAAVTAETMAERAKQMHRTIGPGDLVALDQPDDGMRGALPQYIAGAI